MSNEKVELQTYSALQIAIYAVNCSNSESDIEYVRHAIQSTIDAQTAELKQQINAVLRKNVRLMNEVIELKKVTHPERKKK